MGVFDILRKKRNVDKNNYFKVDWENFKNLGNIVNFKCDKCEFEWKLDITGGRGSFKEIYEKSIECPKCKSSEILYLKKSPRIYKEASKDGKTIIRDENSKDIVTYKDSKEDFSKDELERLKNPNESIKSLKRLGVESKISENGEIIITKEGKKNIDEMKKDAEEFFDEKTIEEFTSPDAVFQCDECKFKWIVRIKKPKIFFKELYEKNGECQNCKSNKISFIVVKS